MKLDYCNNRGEGSWTNDGSQVILAQKKLKHYHTIDFIFIFEESYYWL